MNYTKIIVVVVVAVTICGGILPAPTHGVIGGDSDESVSYEIV